MQMRKYLKSYALFLILAILLIVTQAICELTLPGYLSEIVDVGILQGGSYLLELGKAMVLITLISATSSMGTSFFAAKIATGIGKDLRRDMFKKVESFSNTEFDKFSTASLITRSTNDITQIENVLIQFIRLMFFAPVMGFGSVILSLKKAPGLWWVIAIAIILILIMIITIYFVAFPKFKLVQKYIDQLNLVSRENLSGMMVIRAFNMQVFEEKRFEKANSELTKLSLFINKVMVIMQPVMMFIMNMLTIGIVWIGAHEVAKSVIQVGDIVAFIQYAMHIVLSFTFIAIMFITIPRSAVSAERIAEVLSTDPMIKDKTSPIKFLECFRGIIEFRDVSFRYLHADENVLDHINITIQPGQTTAFIGATGSGKSTIINLIPRFYEVSAGAIFIDGIDIRDVSLHDLREKIGYIPQKSYLFSGTILSNLQYAKANATPEEIDTAIKIAQASEIVSSSSAGVTMEIAQGGQNVSGGQKQRLSIARALIKKPQIYIFDDSFSALDFKTDAALRKALKEEMSKSTVILVSQRISSIRNADQIIVLEEGKIVGKGIHAELMKTCETYKDIALSQLTQEELT
jgi:ATP-binding cassette, subfamily B, multidrug efflux pump